MRTLLFTVFFSWTFMAAAQSIDTLLQYDVNYNRINEGGVISYTLNDKPISKAEFMKFDEARNKSQAEASEKCTPCYARFVNEKDLVISEGLFYSTCPGSKEEEEEEEEVEMTSENSKTIKSSNYPCLDGLWLFYENGQVKSKVEYQLGEEL